MGVVPAPEPVIAARAWRRILSAAWPPVVAGIGILMVWEFAVWWFRLPNFVLPTPQEIVRTALNDPRRLADDTLTTVIEAIGGYVMGAALGLALALAFVVSPIVKRFVFPVYVVINSVPMIAYGPLAIVWLGVGSVSKITLIIVAVSYTILINALAGLHSCDPGAISLLRTFGASDRTILVKLRLPAALPAIFTGLRIAVVHAMILAVVLEMLGAYSGLGWSIYQSTQMMSFVDAWVAVGASVIVSLLVYGAVTWIGEHLVWW